MQLRIEKGLKSFVLGSYDFEEVDFEYGE